MLGRSCDYASGSGIGAAPGFGVDGYVCCRLYILGLAGHEVVEDGVEGVHDETRLWWELWGAVVRI